MEVIKNVENKLLKRHEIEAVIENEGATLKRLDVKKAIAKQLKVDENLVVVTQLRNYFGSTKINVQAKVYDSKESLEKNARPHMVKRNTPKVEKAQGEE